MPSGGPLERATAAHGAPGSLLPKGAAEGAVGRLTRTESAAETAAEVALAPIKDLEFLEGVLVNRDLPAEVVRERLLRFPKEARLPLWVAVWGERLVRLPEAPSDEQVMVYSAAERLHYYVRESAVRRSDETDALTTALARIHFCALVSRGQPQERRAARARLLLDYHPDKTSGSTEWATTIEYIQSCFAPARSE